MDPENDPQEEETFSNKESNGKIHWLFFYFILKAK